MSLLDGDDSPQSVPNPATSTPSTHHRSPYYPPPLNEPYNMHNTAYPPQSFQHFPYHPYHQPPPYPMNFSGGSSQNPPHFPPPYYPPPNNEVHNIPPTKYPYYPYYPPPPTNSNYLSAGSNSTPSSTPTGSMPGLGNSGADVDTIPNEGDEEEVVGVVVGGAKKWFVEDDKRLIRTWINIGTDAVIGSDQKKSSFWKRVASCFNEHRPRGASTRSWKTLNGRWSRCSPLVSKWSGILMEVERSNHNGWNDSMMMEAAQKLFIERIGKRFDLEHWYDMLKDQPTWRTPRAHTTNVGSGSSKRSHSEAEEAIMKLWHLQQHPRRGVKDQREEKLPREGSKRRAITA